LQEYWLDVICREVGKADGNQEMSFDFHQGAARHRQMMEIVAKVFSSVSLGDVSGD